MGKQCDYQCKIANIEEIEEKWDYEISIHGDNPLYIKAKNNYVNEVKKGTRIVYIGKLNGKIICDATAIIKEKGILNEAQSSKDLVSKKRAYLCAFRTKKKYENKGYFSKLYKFMENDLILKGYEEFTLSVDVSKTRNLIIYFKWGYINYLRTEIKYTSSRDIFFNYYLKETKNAE